MTFYAILRYIYSQPELGLSSSQSVFTLKVSPFHFLESLRSKALSFRFSCNLCERNDTMSDDSLWQNMTVLVHYISSPHSFTT